MERKFIGLEIYKMSAFKECDFSGGGLSSKFDYCYVESPYGNLSEKDINPDAIVKLVNNAYGTVVFEPEKPVEKGRIGYMMGGCYVASSDSRFHKLIEQKLGVGNWYGAIALHDRTETVADYNNYD